MLVILSNSFLAEARNIFSGVDNLSVLYFLNSTMSYTSIQSNSSVVRGVSHSEMSNSGLMNLETDCGVIEGMSKFLDTHSDSEDDMALNWSSSSGLKHVVKYSPNEQQKQLDKLLNALELKMGNIKKHIDLISLHEASVSSSDAKPSMKRRSTGREEATGPPPKKQIPS